MVKVKFFNPFCFWGGQPCSDPHNCNDCAVRDREMYYFPKHVIKLLLTEKTNDYAWNGAIDYACKCISFTTQVIKIIESNEFPEYAQDEIINAIKEFRNGEIKND